MEVWKPVKGFEGYYEVSSLARLRSVDRVIKTKRGLRRVKGRLINTYESENEYVRVNLFKDDYTKTIRFHRIVAEAFIPNPDNLPQVNHKDGKKNNNLPENLEWCDNSYNIKHAYDNGLKFATDKMIENCRVQGHNYGSTNIEVYIKSKRKRVCLDNGKDIIEVNSIRGAAKYLDVDPNTIYYHSEDGKSIKGFRVTIM